MSGKTTRKEKIRKLYALAKSPNKHEAALALEKAQALESKSGTGKIIAHTIAQLLEARGLKVSVQRYRSESLRSPKLQKGTDVVVRYRDRRSSSWHIGPPYEIDISEWEWTGREPDPAAAKNWACAYNEMRAARTHSRRTA